VTLILLVDLDDTLLGNDIATFLPAYLQSLAGHMAAIAEADLLIPNLLAATRQMVQNQRPDLSLKDVFDAAFFPALGLERKIIQETFASFYTDIFPSLKRLTQPIPGAVDFVEQVLGCGYELVIATNPLFPRPAILQRLDWAGISPEKYNLRLIASYETFHFSKPNPAYYAEILARLGWPKAPAIMVGDDPQNDIMPARQLGLPAFWIADHAQNPSWGSFAPTSSGSIGDVLPWLAVTSPRVLEPTLTSKEALLAVLQSTPAALMALTSGLTANTWMQPPRAGEWCLIEIMCHLRDVEVEVNLPRLQNVLRETNPFLPGKDTDPWAVERQYARQDGQAALTDFVKARRQLLELLSGITAVDWDRPARHAIFGPTRLEELVSIIVGHDRLHVQQVFQTLNAITNPQ
jgi:FMN phosphatase YigB (HAD superfamily)